MERAAGLGRTAHLRSWQIEGALPLTITYHFQVLERTTLSVFKVTSPSKIRAGGGLTLKEYVEGVSGGLKNRDAPNLDQGLVNACSLLPWAR